MAKTATRIRKRIELAGPCACSDLEVRAHTVITFDNELWSNLGDGRFVLIETINQRKTITKTLPELYSQIKSVMSNGQHIAKFDPHSRILRFTKYPKRVSGHAPIHTVRR